MQIRWGEFAQRSGKYLKTGWLITAGLAALYAGWIEPLNNMRGIAFEKASGLAGVAAERRSLQPRFARTRLSTTVDNAAVGGIVGGVPGGLPQQQMMAFARSASLHQSSGQEPIDGRKTVRTASLDIIVKNPAQAADQILTLAEHLGGQLVSSQGSGSANAMAASISVRLPSARFEEARADIRKMALRVDDDRIEAQDVTKQYVDLEAGLRNRRAEEAQYRAILKQAKTVTDALDASEKLSEVRGQIEQAQAEFEVLSKQTETVALAISLRSETDATVFGLNWRPLYRLKLSARAGLEGLADYATSMADFFFYLPTIVLWLITILLSAAAGWRLLRWTSRRLFGFPRPAVATEDK